uniref:Serpentine receptor class gamma n=1 Tax=Caenorhabditis japonica TaxID=281687 RepID=A0A8R1HM36_CAEJA
MSTSPTTTPLSFITVLAVWDRKCDDSFSASGENVKYLIQIVYLLPAAIVQSRILWILLWKYKYLYGKQSFYQLFVMDCIACFILVVQDSLFARVFQYFPQFCDTLSEFVRATMSRFLLGIRVFTIIITGISTFVTVYRLSRMSKRLISSERSVTLGSFLISACFLGTAAAESLFTTDAVRSSTSLDYFFLPMSWDILNVGTPLVMVFASRQLRQHVFNNVPLLSRSNSKVDNEILVTTVTV